MRPLSPALLAQAGAARMLLARVADEHAPAVFTTSFGAEDMVLLDLVAAGDAALDDALRASLRSIAIVTLDTGRLPNETYDVWQRATERYRRRIDAYFPQTPDVEAFVRVHGINAFYDSLSQRQTCCHIRKVEPLGRALAGKRAWITGLRRAQAASRADVALTATDPERGLLKVNPLVDWSDDDVWTYLDARDVPVNALHAQGYPSIGCAPCTRAVAPGEDARAGRWWWERADAKECGLHVAGREPQPLEA